MNRTTDWRPEFDAEHGIDLSHITDHYTRDHFRMWLLGYLHAETRARIGQHIARLTRDYPELIDRGWAYLRDCDVTIPLYPSQD